MKKFIVSLGIVCSILACSTAPAFAADVDYSKDSTANQVISIQENSINVPSNVTVDSANPVTYDHHSGIVTNHGYRYCWGNCQAKQGTTKLDSYSRARFEMPWYLGGAIYGDSGRCWSINRGISYAQSSTELFEDGESGVAKTYYGIS